MHNVEILCIMKTNVMIRIDEKVAKKAKSAGYNISQISENALISELENNKRTLELKPISVHIIPEIIYIKETKCVHTYYRMHNLSKENLLFGRISFEFTLEIYDEKNEYEKQLDTFSGTQSSMFNLKQNDNGGVRSVHMVRDSAGKEIEQLLKGKGILKFVLNGEAYFRDVNQNYYQIKIMEPEVNGVKILRAPEYSRLYEEIFKGGE